MILLLNESSYSSSFRGYGDKEYRKKLESSSLSSAVGIDYLKKML
jgi:hypothetical protein